MVFNLALFCLATYLATFQKIGQFFPDHLVTLLARDSHTSLIRTFVNYGRKKFVTLATERGNKIKKECYLVIEN